MNQLGVYAIKGKYALHEVPCTVHQSSYSASVLVSVLVCGSGEEPS